jgi:hypothetical protein
MYGGGTLCRYLLASTRFAKLNIVAIIDRSEMLQGKRIADIPIVPPKGMMNGYPIIICTYFSSAEIEKYIRGDLGIGQ